MKECDTGMIKRGERRQLREQMVGFTVHDKARDTCRPVLHHGQLTTPHTLTSLTCEAPSNHTTNAERPASSKSVTVVSHADIVKNTTMMTKKQAPVAPDIDTT